MTYEGGKWTMKDLSKNNPGCFQTPEELVEYIEEIGFLPLFKNNISGFSVEEHTFSDYWWTGDLERDPWEWRAILARDGRVIYGKFFDEKVGFISRKWFPYFANYRREGYDFDALWDDEKASNKQKKIMDRFEEEETELYSFELKEKSGFGKGGEKNFDGVVTGLQMQTYLCITDFRQKKNKAGNAYGMAAAVYAKPEKKWGYEYVTSAYREAPEDSGKRIVRHINDIYPTVAAEQIRKTVGVKDREIVGKKKEKIQYPQNLLEAININESSEQPIDYQNMTEDQLTGVEAMLIAAGELGCWTKNIKKAHIPVTPEILHWHYRDGMRPWEIAEKIDRKNGLEEVRIWRNRIVRANMKYGIGLWAIKGASYKINISDFQKGRVAGGRYSAHIKDLAEIMQQMPEILTGSFWLEAHGVPEGYGKTETNSLDGVCILWKKDNPDIRW